MIGDSVTETFKQTSDKLYDRHIYKLVYSNGQEVIYDNYQDVQESWWNTPSDFVSHIEVLDKKDKKGFG
jgi:hypothetical protein